MQQPAIILFDGVCHLCDAAVRFVISQDKKKKFSFAALQSQSGQQLLQQYGLHTTHFKTFILIKEGRVYKQSAAALTVLKGLSWYWRWTQIFWLVPSVLRDGVYNFIAQNRYKWFGKKEACSIPAPHVRNRFLA